MAASDVLTPFEHQILLEEGFRNRPYRDTRGRLTTGIGFTHGPAMSMPNMTEDQAVGLLRDYYLPQARQAAMGYLGEDRFSSLEGARQLALIDMAYNMGPAGLNKFVKAREAILQGDWERASQEILSSKYAKQVPNRARRNALRMLTGVVEN